MNIKVSIIIPVYNVAPFLDACLSSCINQTFHDIEIIVVNDGSTDDSPRIIQEYAEKDDRVKVITKENQGLVYARKSGLEVAHGEYVFHLDGDDYIEINAIELLYSEVLRSGADYVACNFFSVYEGNKSTSDISNVFYKLSGQELLLSILRYKTWNIWGKLMKKSLFDNIIYYPVSIGEDLFFHMQICLKIKKAVCIENHLHNYVLRSGSMTGQNRRICREVKRDMVRYMFRIMDIYPYNQAIREEVYLLFYYFFLNCIAHKEMEIKTILYNNYWSNKERKTFLWRKRKDFYLITSIFFRSSYLGCLVANVYLFMVLIWRKIRK
ncbi:MAG: glycosyltransferase family 2 protein [Parabacteroides gordonii]|uniref:glycosyltransferase family 2 protein n=1 Tax=Parabacteroides gordonii TaxID=574930 RepID=UPI003A86BC96